MEKQDSIIKSEQTGERGKQPHEQLNRTELLADAALLMVAFIWGGGFVAGKFALESATPFWIMTLRYLGAGILIALCSLKHLRHITRQDLKCGTILGFLMYTGITLQTFALHYTTPGKQSFIVVSYTVLVPLIVWAMTKKRPLPKELVAAVITMIGVALLSLNERLTVGIGELMTFGFAIIFSLQIVFTSRYMKQVSLFPFTVTQMLSAAVFSLISALLFEPVFQVSTLSSTSFWAIAYLMLMNTAAAFLLQNVAQRYAKASHTALIMALESVFGAVDAVVLTGEIFTPRMLVGCVLIFFAILFAKMDLFHKKKDGDSAVS